jgi:putative spermidine/putrescine transport system substrate-binding protein
MVRQLISRRGALKVALGATAGLAAPAIVGSARAQSKNELVFVGFGGAYQEGQAKALFEPFEKETGIKIVQTTGVEIAKLKAQVESKNVEWDIICLPDRLRAPAVKDGLLERLDYSRFSAADLIKDTVTEFCCGAVTLAMQLCYNPHAFSAGKMPSDWLDFWNTKNFPGRRALYANPAYTLEFALIAAGVDKDKLYPLEVEKALKNLEVFKMDGVWWTQFPQVEQILTNKEAVMSPWTRGVTAQLAGKPINVSYDGAAISYEGWVIPKGSKNYDNAMKFIAFATQPKPQAELVKYISFGPSNNKALPLIDPNVAKLLPSDPENYKKGFLFSGAYWGDNLAKVSERFNEWRVG